MDLNKLIIKGARENNLKNISLELPKNKFIVMTGVSGSGKSTLAFNTIYAEGQRRYVESLSSYARQFLGTASKPDVDSIEGLSPAISIEQKTTSHNPRSTVGTVTEINDYLRLLYARVGTPLCPTHNTPIESQSVKQMLEKIFSYEQESRIIILAPVFRNEKGTFKNFFEKALQSGFTRVLINDAEFRLDEDSENINLDKNKRYNISLVVDRLLLDDKNRSRVAEALETALKWANGLAQAKIGDELILFSQRFACSECGFSIFHLEPRLFSFNAPLGACEECRGLGLKKEIDVRLLIPNPELSIDDGGIIYLQNKRYSSNIEWQEFEYLCHLYNIDMAKPIKNFTAEEMSIILDGSPKSHTYVIETSGGNQLRRSGQIEGVRTKINRLFLATSSSMMREYYSGFFADLPCPKCRGQRLNQQALAVKIGDLNIAELSDLSIEKAFNYIADLKFSTMKEEIAHLILKEIKERLGFLINVGLEYLTLARSAATLSGGEAQRIRLATQIGTKLSGVLYVLDEPSIGLHQRDNMKLINTLKTMRDLGNTLVVVEHDEETMLEADWIVDIGPGAGIHGGEIIAEGTAKDIMASPTSLTGDYLANRKFIPVPSTRRKGNGKFLEVIGASQNNLNNINVKIPLGLMAAVTGVSGSGKSTLVNEVICNNLLVSLHGSKVEPGRVKAIKGMQYIDKIIAISQDPIGRTPRSNPATYVTVFNDIRDIFALTSEARTRGYDRSLFSFNLPGGRCEKCEGDGVIKVEMHFLADIYVTCDVCQGKRYKDEILQVQYKEKNIADVLDMTIEEAYNFFIHIPPIKRKMQSLVDVGLGYIKVGQSATTLSGGEAQRVKLAYELQRRPTGKTLYLLDEPTTGLHTDDVKKLLIVLNQLVDAGESMIIIEHNLDVIKSADYIIDLGPNGGDRGGQIIFEGTPEEIINHPTSYTGHYLKKYFQTKKAEE